MCILNTVNRLSKANLAFVLTLRISFRVFRALPQRLGNAGRIVIPTEVCPVSDKTETHLFLVYTSFPLTKLPLEMYIFIPGPLVLGCHLFVLCFATDKGRKYLTSTLEDNNAFKTFLPLLDRIKILPETMSNLFSRKSRWLCSLDNRLDSLTLRRSVSRVMPFPQLKCKTKDGICG